jgi:hypothetical protein
MSERSWEQLVEENERDIGEAWTPAREPEQPQTLVGTVVGYQQVSLNSGYGEGEPWVCTIEDRDGHLWAVWLFQTVLVGEFERWRPMPGERVVLRYKGLSDKAPAGRQPYHQFVLTVDRGGQGLPGFLTDRPEVGSDIPTDTAGLPAGRSQVDQELDDRIADAQVVDEPEKEGDDGDPIPF